METLFPDEILEILKEKDDFELDMEEGNYNKWVEKYPKYLESIFTCLLSSYEDLNTEDISFFTKKGIDINKKFDIYGSGIRINPLQYCCSRLASDKISALIKSGADINFKDSYSLFDYVLSEAVVLSEVSHDYQDIKRIIEYLLSEGCIKSLNKFTREELLERKDISDPFLIEFIKKD